VRFIPEQFEGQTLKFVVAMASMALMGVVVGIVSTAAGYPVNPGATAAMMMLGSWLAMHDWSPTTPSYWWVALGSVATLSAFVFFTPL